jgi:hypothetical protein
MKPRVYVETSVISYLTARPSRDLVVAAHQQLTHVWWQTARSSLDLCASEFVVREAGAGDSEFAQKRLDLLQRIALLDATDPAIKLASAIIASGVLPSKAANDASHVAVAAIHNVEFLVTWNCRHLANARIRAMIEQVCASHGFRCPTICTPEQLLATEGSP